MKKLWCGAIVIPERENKWAFCTAAGMSKRSAHLACYPAPPLQARTQRRSCEQGCDEKDAAAFLPSPGLVDANSSPGGSALWAQFMVALAPVFAECLPCILPYARGGGNARKHKSWLLSSKVLQPGLDYRMNLQKTFYFRRIIDEAQTPRAMNAWSWRDCWGWGKYPWKVSKGKAVFPLDLSAE